MDTKVKRPANVFAYVFGAVGSIVMGCGMSLVMTDIAVTLGIPNALPVGIAVGVLGLISVLLNYPIYKGIVNSRKKKYASRIIELSDSLLNK